MKDFEKIKDEWFDVSDHITGENYTNAKDYKRTSGLYVDGYVQPSM